MTLAVRWVGSPNYSPGRDGHNPNWAADDPNTWIVLHTMVGTMASATAAFLSPGRQASSHYGVGLDGSIVQFVREEDAAWTNGTYADNPGSNLDSITIEHEDGGDYNGPRTPELYEASAQLLADISRRRGIPLIHRGPGGGVLRHKECNGASTACPDSLDIDRIIARANAILNPSPPPPAPPPDTRAEWQKNLVALPASKTFNMFSDCQVLDLVNGSLRGIVSAGTILTVAFETKVGGIEYWVTTFGSTHGDGLRKEDVAAASTPPAPIPTPTPVPPPTPVPTPEPPGGWQAFLDWLAELLRSILGRPTPK